MRQMFTLLEDVAATNATVLIEGETGTGKELIAEEIHNHSPRKDGPFVVFDCGAVPRELIESMLFGHVKGSFTGAITDRRGAFAEAHGGTIFLDEIGELALDLQPSLLRVLDKRAVRKVGANTYEKIDVRVVAATNRDLRAEVAKKAFREDLYYRLAVIRVSVPPLRERGSDIPLLIQHFVNDVRPGPHGHARGHGAAGAPQLAGQRARAAQRDRARLPARARRRRSTSTTRWSARRAPSLGIRTDLPFKEAKGQLVEIFEREYIEDLMRRHKMNLSAAAREAQIDRKHLRELIRKYGLDPRAQARRRRRRRRRTDDEPVRLAAARPPLLDAHAEREPGVLDDDVPLAAGLRDDVVDLDGVRADARCRCARSGTVCPVGLAVDEDVVAILVLAPEDLDAGGAVRSA